MTHPLVTQLRFTRSEFKRALSGISDEDARRHFPPMNCISWNVGHLAWQEQRYFILFVEDRLLLPEINQIFAYGAPGTSPALSEVWQAWEAITKVADHWLDSVTNEKLLKQIQRPGWDFPTNYGSLLQRVIYHYWYHTGENMAIRQMLGHTGLPEFVGDIDREAPFQAN